MKLQSGQAVPTLPFTLLKSAETEITLAVAKHVDLIVFPARAIAETALERLQETARENRITVVVGMEHRVAGRRRNTAVVIGPDGSVLTRGAGVYGFNWWVNVIKPDGQRHWPGAPPRTFYANGLHNNVCIVVPEWNLVIARTNDGKKDGSANTPANVDEIWSGFFSQLAEAITPRKSQDPALQPSQRL